MAKANKRRRVNKSNADYSDEELGARKRAWRVRSSVE